MYSRSISSYFILNKMDVCLTQEAFDRASVSFHHYFLLQSAVKHDVFIYHNHNQAIHISLKRKLFLDFRLILKSINEDLGRAIFLMYCRHDTERLIRQT